MKGVVQMLAVNDTLDYLTAEIYEQMKKHMGTEKRFPSCQISPFRKEQRDS